MRIRKWDDDTVLQLVPASRLRRARSNPRRYRAGLKPISLSNPKSSGHRELRWLQLQNAEAEAEGLFVGRPRTFGECRPGPCPWVSCRYHLYLDVDESTGIIKVYFPDKNPVELTETCSIRAAERFHDALDDSHHRAGTRKGAATLEQIGRLTNRTQENTNIILRRAIRKVRAALPEFTKALKTRAGRPKRAA